MKNFDQKILDIPAEQRCYQNVLDGNTGDIIARCYFGLTPSLYYYEQSATAPYLISQHRVPLKVIPKNARQFEFYYGGSQTRLIEYFTNSFYPSITQSLSVGYSSYGYGGGYDYSAITATLANNHFNALKSLNIGIFKCFHNTPVRLGYLGDITNMLEAMPNLEELHLYGNFKLTRTPTLPKLNTLSIKSATLPTQKQKELSQNSLDKLLCCDLMHLESLDIELDSTYALSNEQKAYTLPELFLGRSNIPNLALLKIHGKLEEQTRKRLIEYTLSNKQIIWRIS